MFVATHCFFVLHNPSQSKSLHKLVSTQKKKGQNKKQFSRLDDTSKDFVIVIGTNVNTIGNETLESQVKGHHEFLEDIVDNTSQNQVKASNTDERTRNVVYIAVLAVENFMHDAVLTALKNMINPLVDMAVRLITGSSGNGPNCLIQNPDRRNFTGNTETTRLMSASSRLDFNIERDEIDKTRDFDKSEDGHFPATRFNYDRREHANHMETGVGCAHHMVTKQNAPHHIIPDFFTGRSTQNNPLPKQFTQPQNITSRISTDNTCFTRQHIANC